MDFTRYQVKLLVIRKIIFIYYMLSRNISVEAFSQLRTYVKNVSVNSSGTTKPNVIFCGYAYTIFQLGRTFSNLFYKIFLTFRGFGKTMKHYSLRKQYVVTFLEHV